MVPDNAGAAPANPAIPNAQVLPNPAWSNYAGTIGPVAIPTYVTPDPLGPGLVPAAALQTHGQALAALLKACFSGAPTPLRTLGSGWSFSSIIRPGPCALDPANMNYIDKDPERFLGADYAARRGNTTLLYIEGGTTISAINRRIGQIGLALQTSGAADGQRIAGAISTGTHGSARTIGALHDTVRGVHLLVAPDKALFVQPTSPTCTPDFAAWLAGQTGIATDDVPQDELFQAAQVSLGSLGIVLGVVVETVPLYQFRVRQFQCASDDPRLLAAIDQGSSAGLHPDVAELPYHFDVVLNPYPPAGGGAFVTLLWKVDAPAGPPPAVLQPPLLQSSDTLGMIAQLAQALGDRLLAPLERLALSKFTNDILAKNCPTTDGQLLYPGQKFGPTTLPSGNGASTEIFVDVTNGTRALQTIRGVLEPNAGQGKFLLGTLGVRFTAQTDAWLGMNQGALNCSIELPSIRDANVLGIYTQIWDALEAAGIPFTCHWGQLLGLNARRLQAYFGDGVRSWQAARRALLGNGAAPTVFAAPLLAEVGL